ncbi:MAG: ABC transporter permease [Caldisphaera sp.]
MSLKPTLSKLLPSIIFFVVMFMSSLAINPSMIFYLPSTLIIYLPYAFLGIGQLFVMMTGEIDISLGTAISLINVSFVTLYGRGINGPVLIIFPILLGLIIGIINGILVGFVRINSLLATIATMSVWQGLALYILPSPGGSLPFWIIKNVTSSVFYFPSYVIFIIILLVIWYVFKKHKYLKYFYSTGSDIKSAFENGINVNYMKFFAFVLDGLMIGISGLIVTSYMTSGDATVGPEFLLPSIVAAVIGGASLYGGKGDILATMLSGLGLGFLNNTLFAITTLVIPPAYSSLYKDFIYGVILIITLILIGAYEVKRK